MRKPNGRDAGEIREFDLVRLTTDKYIGLGLPSGTVGTVMDIPTKPTLGYTVELHEISTANLNKVTTFSKDEIRRLAQPNGG